MERWKCIKTDIGEYKVKLFFSVGYWIEVFAVKKEQGQREKERERERERKR